MGVVIVPFASRLHGIEYYTKLLEDFRRLVSEAGGGVSFTPVVADPGDIKSLTLDCGRDTLIFTPLTGGVSSLIAETALACGARRVILFGHGEHNSLASAISAKVKLEARGIGTALFHCLTISEPDCVDVVKRMLGVARAVSTLSSSRILLIGDFPEKPRQAGALEERFGSKVDVYSIDGLASRFEPKPGYAEFFEKAFEKAEYRLPKDRIGEVARLYALLKTASVEGGYNAIAIDCFPYILKHGLTPCLPLSLLNSEGIVAACEGDLASLALMLASRELTGYTGWIANLSGLEGSRAYFAHCTISLNMVDNPIVLSHFESGSPYSLTGRLRNSLYTIASLSPGFDKIAVAVGRIVESGLLSNAMCRTQALVELGFDSQKLLREAVANHHVLIPGDVKRELSTIADLFRIRLVEYEKV
ncbi:fucose isomerase [Thermogladius sp. 4427co]|uniref:fucose isomerase n=1 Tax=Thermogladius sp. 4427co TaxID=3450718 RepID=UPI003F78F209